jgi:hypothetical protein
VTCKFHCWHWLLYTCSRSIWLLAQGLATCTSPGKSIHVWALVFIGMGASVSTQVVSTGETLHQLVPTRTTSLALVASHFAGCDPPRICGCSTQCAVYVVTPDGNITRIAGQEGNCNWADGPGTTSAALYDTTSICVDSTERNLYVTDQ